MESIKRRARLRIPAKASVWYIISSAVARGVGVFGTPIFTRLLTAEEYGLFPLYTTWLGLITVIATLELTGSVTMRGLQKHSDRPEKFISAAFGLCIAVTLIISTVYFLFSDRINSFTGLSTAVTAVLLINVLINTATSFYTAKCKYEYRYKSVALINILSALGVPILSVFIVTVTPLRAEGRIIGAVLVGGAIALPLAIKMIRSCPKLFDFKIWKYLLKINIPLLPHYLSAAIIIRIAEVTIAQAFGSSALGKYSVAMSVGLSLTMITNGLLSALSPWMLRKIKEGKLLGIKDFLLILTRGLCLLCLVILAVVPETIKIVTPPAYRDVLPAVYPLALSTIPMFLSSALTSAEMYYERPSYTSAPSIAAAAASTLLTLILLPRIDYRYAGLFVLGAYTLMTALNFPLFKRLSGVSPLRIRSTLTTSLLTAVYAFLLFLLRDHPLSRITLALPLLPMLFITAKKIYNEIKE